MIEVLIKKSNEVCDLSVYIRWSARRGMQEDR